jgi:predicted kinase
LPGAGKTTYARRLAADTPAVRFTLDEWMLRLYPWRYDEPEYVAHLDGCKDLIWDVARQVLALGHDVVLDWNQWSRERRAEWRQRAEAVGCPVVLHHLETPVDTAIRRVEERAARAAPRSHLVDAAAVRHLQTILEEPGGDEGMEIRAVGGAADST